MKKRKVIIGIDGVPYELIDNLSNQGIMPNFNFLKKQKNNIFSKLMSSIPHISSVSWSSIITGSNPGKHGIFGFTDLIPNTYTLSFPDFNTLKTKPFWHQKPDKKYVIINVPSTYPVKPLNGVHISGFISLDLEKAVYPKSEIENLKKMDYHVDVDSSIAHESKSLFLKKLKQVNEARIKAYRYFWHKEDWDVFMLVFTGSDRLEHFLWDAYENKNHEYHQEFLNYFKRVDEVIGEISNEMNKNDSLIMLSDHGMESVETNVYLNKFLQEKGLLSLDKKQKGYNQIAKKSKAFVLDPGRIYLHKKNKYPNGIIEKNNEKQTIKQLIKIFSQLKYNNKKVIKKIYYKQEIYHGPELEKAPDLVLIENNGLRLRGSLSSESIFKKDIFTGDHTLDNAFLFVKGHNVKTIVPKNPNVEDIVSILNKL